MLDGTAALSADLRLSREDRDMILAHATAIPKELVSKLRLGVFGGRRLTFALSVGDLRDLVDALAFEADHASPRRLRRRFSRIHAAVSQTLEKYLVSAEDPDAEALTGPYAEFRRATQQAVKSHPLADLDGINKKLDEVSAAHNRRPQPDFDGLSPLQVSRLIYVDWDAPESALLLDDTLPLDEVREAEILDNARVFLHALLESGGTPATSSGNLNRKFVRAMVDCMRFEPGYLNQLKFFRQVWNEDDVFPLHVLRVVLVIAGLVRKFKGSFRATKKGERMGRDQEAGKLYAHLFRTFFRRFNLAYGDFLDEFSGIQDTVAYSLCMAGRHADAWVRPERLATKLILPAIAAEIPASPFDHVDDEESLAQWRIISPLVRFGLLEGQYEGEEGGPLRWHLKRVRKTPLFDRFLTFQLDGESPWPV